MINRTRRRRRVRKFLRAVTGLGRGRVGGGGDTNRKKFDAISCKRLWLWLRRRRRRRWQRRRRRHQRGRREGIIISAPCINTVGRCTQTPSTFAQKPHSDKKKRKRERDFKGNASTFDMFRRQRFESFYFFFFKFPLAPEYRPLCLHFLFQIRNVYLCGVSTP